MFQLLFSKLEGSLFKNCEMKNFAFQFMHSPYPFFPFFYLEIYSAGEVSLAVIFLASEFLSKSSLFSTLL
jgi:hypothetical protein